MKFKSTTLACSLLLAVASAPSFAVNETSRIWYASSLGNAAVVETTVGCIDQVMMYEKHVVTANTWNNKWFPSRDYNWTLSIFNNQNLPTSADNAKVFTLDTSRLHDSAGSTVDAQGKTYSATFYAFRAYEPTTSIRENNNVGSGSVGGYLGLDANCDAL